MHRFRQFMFRFGSLFRRRRIEAELADELRAHVDMATEANVAAGMEPGEARLAALRQSGGVEQAREAYRDERWFPWLDQVAQDLRYAGRTLAKSRTFTAIAILTLALGIGINTTTFSFINAVLFQKVPYPEPDRLVRIYRTDPHVPQLGRHSPGDLFDLKAQAGVFSQFAILDFPSFSLSEPGQLAERVGAFAVSGDYFPMLGVRPLLGRVFGTEEDKPGRNNVIVLSYRFWQRRFAGDKGVLGRTLRLDGEAVTVIGVMPEEFDVPLQWGVQDIWKPLGMKADMTKVRDGYWLQVMARLKPGVSLEQAQANLDTIAARLSHDYPLTNKQAGFHVVGLEENDSRKMFYMVMGLAVSVLLIACANLANLQLARNSRRAHEFSIRIALGGSRPRLIRQMITESLLLALLGGAVGVLVAWATNQVLARRVANLLEEPTFRMPLDLRVLGFALFAALATGLLFGIAPAWMLSRVDANTGLKQSGTGLTGGKGRRRMRHGLIVAELALTLGLMVSAGYFVQAVQKLMARDLGWDAHHLLLGRFALPGARYDSVEKCAVFYDKLNAELGSVPGVASSVTCDSMPFAPFFNSRPMVAEGATVAPGQEPLAYVNMVSPGYFGILQMKLLRGRDFTERDRKGAPEVVIINETMARQFWPGQTPLGKRIGGIDPAKRDWFEVVGVVNEVGYTMVPNVPSHLQIYRPMAQTGGNYFGVVARTTVPPGTLLNALRRALHRVDPDQAVYDLTTADEQLARMQDFNFILGTGLGIMAVSGLLLSTLGLYGVISGLVQERTREIGIRVALGAQVREVIWFVLRQGLRLAGLGVGIGLAGAWGLGQILRAAQPDAERQGPAVLLGSALFLLCVALLASWLPARRAARVNPVVALRTE